MSLTLYDLVTRAGKARDHVMNLTKKEFGRIMHDPDATDAEVQEALKQLEEADGYENLGD